ncbi:MAG: OmpA family protein [Marinoscillum sp.]
MNVHLTSGIVAFICWSAFSTWYYVSFIKDFGTTEPVVTNVISAPLPEPVEEPADTLSEASPVEFAPVNINESFLFAKNSTVLLKPGQMTVFIESVQRDIKDREVSVTIVGHTCDLGGEAYNQTLGLQRARFFENLIKELVPPENISVKSMGETDPMVTNDSEENRKQNRRVNLLITTEL